MIKLVALSRTKFGETYQVLCLKHEDYTDHIDDLEDPMEILFIGNDVYEIPWIDRETLVTSHAGWRLASALYSYRETGSIADVPEVELPDGTIFIIDEELGQDQYAIKMDDENFYDSHRHFMATSYQ